MTTFRCTVRFIPPSRKVGARRAPRCRWPLTNVKLELKRNFEYCASVRWHLISFPSNKPSAITARGGKSIENRVAPLVLVYDLSSRVSSFESQV